MPSKKRIIFDLVTSGSFSLLSDSERVTSTKIYRIGVVGTLATPRATLILGATFAIYYFSLLVNEDFAKRVLKKRQKNGFEKSSVAILPTSVEARYLH